MNRELHPDRLPEPVERYFREVAAMHPPADLMDGVVDEIEATPQHHTNRFVLMPLAAAVLAVATVAAGVWALSPDGPIGIGTDPPSSATAQPDATPIPAATRPPVDELPLAGTADPGPTIAELYPIRMIAHGSLWLVNFDTDELVRYDAGSGAVIARIDLAPGGFGMNLGLEDGVVAASDEWIFVPMEDRRIARVDPSTNEIVDRLAPEVRPWAMAVDGGELWAVDYLAEEVVRIDIETGEEVARIVVEGGPRALTFADGRAWVVLAEASALAEIDLGSNSVVAEYPVGCCVTYLAAHDGSLYLSTGGTLPAERFSLAERRVVARADGLGWVQEHRGRMVGLDRAGYLAVLDPDTLAWEAVIRLEPFEVAALIAVESTVWVDTSPDGRTREITLVTLGE